jgi:hypothetical protein
VQLGAASFGEKEALFVAVTAFVNTALIHDDSGMNGSERVRTKEYCNLLATVP